MTDKFQQLADKIDAALLTGDNTAIATILAEIASAEIARLLESLPPKERLSVWAQVAPKRCAKVDRKSVV